jgi:hypothetical protein
MSLPPPVVHHLSISSSLFLQLLSSFLVRFVTSVFLTTPYISFSPSFIFLMSDEPLADATIKRLTALKGTKSLPLITKLAESATSVTS